MQYIGWYNVGKTMPFSPPITGTGNHNIPIKTPIKMLMTGGWFMALFYPQNPPTCQGHVVTCVGDVDKTTRVAHVVSAEPITEE